MSRAEGDELNITEFLSLLLASLFNFFFAVVAGHRRSGGFYYLSGQH
jgi:hypothetical protein